MGPLSISNTAKRIANIARRDNGRDLYWPYNSDHPLMQLEKGDMVMLEDEPSNPYLFVAWDGDYRLDAHIMPAPAPSGRMSGLFSVPVIGSTARSLHDLIHMGLIKIVKTRSLKIPSTLHKIAFASAGYEVDQDA